VKIAEPGEYTVLAKPADPEQWQAINPWKVQLVPAE
jgi:hypothetical protein